ncbi:peroxiredoxin, Ohr subfamily [Flexibacter flexilis DSM 6793]|uniref:Peroxiredoxin, Ohr subfamily n=1 Tax=Flexibacter flexilis DSM 6793 TaxID=927664 RepID=A0A1I1DH69_9BACT|nr:organic hydroperoxide resistance protein [Flexibacter flexilis]SFB74197.1 peroxiredoxin, Ohr subfamily [Flexibacter flexilis DSM 6793]
MEILYTAQASAQGGRNGHVRSSDDVLNLEVRMPKSLGGTGGAYTNPEQLFAAGYAACFDSALNLVARMQKVAVQDTVVTANVSIGKTEAGGFGLAVALEVKIPNVERSVAEGLLQAAHAVCPYSNATRGNIEVSLKLVD